MQQIVLVPTGAAEAAIPVPKHGLVLASLDAAAIAWAARTGLPTETLPAMSVTELENLVRARAVADRWRDLVVVADARTVRALAAALTNEPGTSALAGADDVVTVGLPRGTKPVRPRDVVGGGLLVTLATFVLIDALYPLLLSVLVAAGGLVLLPWARTRHLGRTLLAVAGVSAVLVFLLVAGSTRFPTQ